MILSPYQPPNESPAEPVPSTSPARSRSAWFRATQFICYGWLAFIVLIWQLDGLNVLIQRDIGRLVSLSTACVSVIVAVLYIRDRARTMKFRCIVFVTSLALLQYAVINAIDNHSVDRFPM